MGGGNVPGHLPNFIGTFLHFPHRMTLLYISPTTNLVLKGVWEPCPPPGIKQLGMPIKFLGASPQAPLKHVLSLMISTKFAVVGEM